MINQILKLLFIHIKTSNIIKMQKYITKILNYHKNTFSKLNSVCCCCFSATVLDVYCLNTFFRNEHNYTKIKKGHSM